MTFRASDFGLGDRDPSTIRNVVFFHYPCKDGLAAAYVLHQVLDHDETVYLPSDYVDDAWSKSAKEDATLAFKSDVWALLKDRRVWVADFSFPINVLLHMATVAEDVVVYDHHKSFRENLVEFSSKCHLGAYASGPLGEDINPTQVNKQVDWYAVRIPTAPNLQIRFSDKYCGAYLTLLMTQLDECPWTDCIRDFITYIDDRDMWKWKQEQSKEFHAALDLAAPKDFFSISQFIEGDRKAQLTVGKQLVRYFNSKVDELVKRAVLMHVRVPFGDLFLHYQVPVVNAVDHISEVGHALLVAYPEAPFSATFFVLNNGAKKWSLRGRDSDAFDASSVAKAFGGGGHAKACGFVELAGEGKGFLDFPVPR